MPQRRPHDGKPDINRISKEELMQVPSIEEEMAERIIRHRPYTSASDLHWLFQVGDKRIEHLKEALYIPGEPSGKHKRAARSPQPRHSTGKIPG